MIYFVINLFTAQGYQLTIHRCAPRPCRPPRMRRSFGRPCRCAREAACARAISAPAPARLRARRGAPASARRQLRWPSARASARAASSVLPDGLRLARCYPGTGSRGCVRSGSTASAPSSSRHLRHDRQARRRHHGHEDLAAGTPTGSAAWPRRREACACETCEAREPGAGILEAERRHRRTARLAHHRVRPRRLRPGHRRLDRNSKHHRGLVAA